LWLPFYRRNKDGTIVFNGSIGCLTDDCKYWNDKSCNPGVKDNNPDLCKLPQDPRWPDWSKL